MGDQKVRAKGRPTVWRTCRVLANEDRLRMLYLIMGSPGGLSVSEVRAHFHISAPQTSLWLRSLNARGLLRARKVVRNVFYEAKPDPQVPAAAIVLRQLKRMFRQNGLKATRPIYRAATALTHPRRVEIVRVLSGGPMNEIELEQAAGMPRQALFRHLAKLMDRGFVVERADRFELASIREPMSRTLLRIATDPELSS